MNCWNNYIARFICGMALLPLFLVGCKNKEQVTTERGNVKQRNTETLIQQLRQNEATPEWLSLRMGVAFETSKMSDSFKMNLRMKKDSVIWISATYYAVEIARFLFTPDSVFYLDRRGSTYFRGGFSLLNDSFNLDVNFESLQALILGNSIGVEDSAKIHSGNRNGYYYLSTVKKKQMRRAFEMGNRNSGIAISNWLDPKTFKVARLALHDPRTSRSMVASYSEFEPLEDQLFPHKVDLNIVSHSDSTKIKIDYLKVNHEGPFKFSFRIPEKYDRVQP